MIQIEIPGRGELTIKHLVLDVNGTLALDGKLLPGVAETLHHLRSKVDIHLVTANTHGKQDAIDQQLNLKATLLKRGGEADQKAKYIQSLGASETVAIGQGANDAGMIKEAAIGICVLSQEGSALSTLLSADIVAPDILSALGLLKNPMRLVASLRK